MSGEVIGTKSGSIPPLQVSVTEARPRLGESANGEPASWHKKRQLLITRLGIQEAMIITQINNKLPRFRDALTFSALLLVLPAVYPAQEADRFQLSPPALQAGRLSDVEPQLGPQPPCGKEPIPPYPDLDDLAIVKLWSKSALGRDWKPPACTGWAEVGFTTLVTIAARFPHTSAAGGLLRHIGAISELAGIDYSQAVANINCGCLRSDRLATSTPPTRRHGDASSH